MQNSRPTVVIDVIIYIVVNMPHCVDLSAANPDPLANMAGDRFSSVKGEDLSAYRYMEEIMKSPREEAEEDAELKKVTLKLVMHIQKLDSDLLQYYAEAVSSYVSF